MKTYTIRVSPRHSLEYHYSGKEWWGNVRSDNSGAYILTSTTSKSKEECLVFTAIDYGKYLEGKL